MRNATILAVLLAGGFNAYAEPRFSASDIPSARLRKSGRVVISNDRSAITAWHFDGDIKNALVSLKSVRVVAQSAAQVVFDLNAKAPVPTDFASHVQQASRMHGVDPRLIAAVARQESAWNPRAVSPVGACGLMQLMPATAQYLGVRDVFDPRQNIFGGTRYLKTLLATFNGDLDLTLAAYNAGPGAVAKYRGIPPYRETRAYVAKVRASFERSAL